MFLINLNKQRLRVIHAFFSLNDFFYYQPWMLFCAHAHVIWSFNPTQTFQERWMKCPFLLLLYKHKIRVTRDNKCNNHKMFCLCQSQKNDCVERKHYYWRVGSEWRLLIVFLSSVFFFRIVKINRFTFLIMKLIVYNFYSNKGMKNTRRLHTF